MLREKLKKFNVILASGSPRRQQFFKELNLDYSIQLKEVDEIYPEELKGAEITDFLADLKSKSFTDLNENDLLITSDTIVWLDNKAFGKPKNNGLFDTSLAAKTVTVIAAIKPIEEKATENSNPKILRDSEIIQKD